MHDHEHEAERAMEHLRRDAALSAMRGEDPVRYVITRFGEEVAKLQRRLVESERRWATDYMNGVRLGFAFGLGAGLFATLLVYLRMRSGT